MGKKIRRNKEKKEKGDTLEASKSAHPFELNTIKPMHGTGVNQVATDMLCPYQGITKGFGFEIYSWGE